MLTSSESKIGLEEMRGIYASYSGKFMLYSNLMIGKRDLFIFTAPGVTSFSFSNCTEDLGLRLVLLYIV